MNEYVDILRSAIRHYGSNTQIDVAIEEMAELTQALVKCKRYAEDKDFERFRQNVVEEIADVEIMINQLFIIFDISCGEVLDIQNEKLSRLRKRIEEDRNNAAL